MLALFTFAALLNGAASLRVVASRTSSISMGLAVGEKFPATALSAMGVSGKKACIFFYGADDAPSCSKELKAFDAAGKNFTTAGVAVVGVRFEEPDARGRKYLLGTRSNGRATGRFWVDPLTGAIHQTELWVDSRQDRTYAESATVAVTYAPNDTLGLLLPSVMTGSHEEFDASGMRQAQTGGGAGADVDGRVTLQSRAQYSNPTFAAIDLTKFRR